MNLKKIIPNSIGNVNVESIIERGKIRIIFNHTNHVKSSISLPSRINNEKLFAAGLAIFAGEGSNKFHTNGSAKEVEVVNSNPAIIKTFIKFLELLDFSRNKLKARLELTISHAEIPKIERCEKFWSKIAGIPKENFNKPIIKISNSTTKKRKSEFGSLVILLFSKPLWRLLNHWSKNLDKLF